MMGEVTPQDQSDPVDVDGDVDDGAKAKNKAAPK